MGVGGDAAVSPSGLDSAAGLTVPDMLVAAIVRGGSPAALVAVFGPPWGRHEACRLWRRLVDSGVVVPGRLESMGAVVPARRFA